MSSELALERSVSRQVGRPSLLNGRTAWMLVFLGAFVCSLFGSGVFRGEVVNENGWPLVWRFLRAALHPELSREMLVLAGQSLFVTLAFAVVGAALSVTIGTVTGIVSSETWWRLVLPGHASRLKGHLLPWWAFRFGFAVPRSVHEVIWGLFFINVFGLDPMTAILAIGIPFGLITGKVFSEIIDETPQQSLNALRSAGAPPFQAFLYGLLPQAFPYMQAYALYRLECALRAAAVLGLIGAGGLGYQILLSLQSLRYQQVWVFLYSLILLIAVADAWSSLLNRRLNVTVQAGRVTSRRGRPTPGRGLSDPFLRGSLAVAVFLVPVCFLSLRSDLSRVFGSRAFGLLIGVLRESFPPRLPAGHMAELLQLSAQTLGMSILAMTIAGLGGLLLAFPASTTFMSSGMSGVGSRGATRFLRAGVLVVTRGLLLVSRAFSDAIWVLIVLFVLFPGPLPGAIGLGLYNLGVLGRLMAQVNENLDARPLQALQAQGASSIQVFVYGALPNVLPKYLSYVLYRWEVCTRATVVAGIVGAGGLGRRLEEQLSSFDYPSAVTTLLCCVAITFLVDMTSAAVRRTLRPRGRGLPDIHGARSVHALALS